MKYYLTETGNGVSLDGTLPPGSVECTKDQHDALHAWAMSDGAIVPRVISDAEAAIALRLHAMAALDKSDVTVLRCMENSVAVPPEWAAYRGLLRAIIGSSSDAPAALPSVPPYPSGT
jgi:hypothetical protein